VDIIKDELAVQERQHDALDCLDRVGVFGRHHVAILVHHITQNQPKVTQDHMAPPHDLVKGRVLELLERQHRLLEGGKESDQFLEECPRNVIKLAQFVLHL